jgi:protein-disulfide isomerase
MVVVLGAAFFLLPKANNISSEDLNVSSNDISEKLRAQEPAAGESPSETNPSDVSATENIQAPSETAAAESAPVLVDVARALSPRIQGNPDAKVTVSEHSSLTCGHCGAFHKNTYPKLKADYIDTGKIKLVFSDFPLNGAALHASMIARCLPEERHASFVQLLFETQDKWAYDATGYINYLKQNAQLAGLSPEAFDACIGNKELESGIATMVSDAQTKHQISSTPTFIINGTKSLSGALPYEEFKKVLDEAIAAAETRSETPSE